MTEASIFAVVDVFDFGPSFTLQRGRASDLTPFLLVILLPGAKKLDGATSHHKALRLEYVARESCPRQQSYCSVDVSVLRLEGKPKVRVRIIANKIASCQVMSLHCQVGTPQAIGLRGHVVACVVPDCPGSTEYP